MKSYATPFVTEVTVSGVFLDVGDLLLTNGRLADAGEVAFFDVQRVVVDGDLVMSMDMGVASVDVTAVDWLNARFRPGVVRVQLFACEQYDKESNNGIQN